jgi:hypothetical protein
MQVLGYGSLMDLVVEAIVSFYFILEQGFT